MSGRVGRSPAMNGLLMPRRASCTDSVAVETVRSAAVAASRREPPGGVR